MKAIVLILALSTVSLPSQLLADVDLDPEVEDRIRKDSYIASYFSAVLPGSGQFYNGDNRRGWAMFGIEMTSLLIMRSVTEDDVEMFGEIIDVDDNNDILIPVFLVWLGNRVVSFIDASIRPKRIYLERVSLSEKLGVRPIKRGAMLSVRF